MAKGKPSRAFLEALQNEKKRRGDDKPGGGFKTPEWFVNKTQPGESRPAQVTLAMPAVGKSAKRGYRYVWWHGAAAAAVLVTTIAIALIAGRRGNPSSRSTDSGSAKTAPVQSSALEVPRDHPTIPTGLKPPALVPAAGTTGAAGAPAVAEPAGRVAGMNYVVILCESPENEARANQAADILRKAGIGCTIEKNHPYGPKWILVIGTTGFVKTNTPEYQQYIRKLMQISDKYAGSSKWKKFEPNAYKWR